MTDRAGELLAVVALAFTVLGTTGTVAWWLIAPRVRTFVADLVAAAEKAGQQLDAEQPGSTAAHAATAARAAIELPELRETMRQLGVDVAALTAADLVSRLALVELLIERHDQRLGAMEQLQLQLVAAGFLPMHRPPTPATHRAGDAHDQTPS